MNTENILISSTTVDIAEHDLYLELQNRLCYYDDKNLNNVLLPYKGCEKEALAYAQTLINMPVQAKYKKVNNLDDLGSHELSITNKGEVVWGTESIGTHTAVEIKEDTVTTVSGETKVLPCLFATCRIWKRNANMISAIKRLFSSNKGLNSSWEISTNSYEFNNGVKTLKDYAFLGNTFLGSTVTPAYNGTSKALSLSALSEQELLIADALSQDLLSQGLDIENQAKEENNLQKDIETNVAEETVVETPVAETAEETTVETETSETPENNETASEETPVEEPETSEEESVISEETVETQEPENAEEHTETEISEPETSALTEYDLRKKIRVACHQKLGKDCYIAFHFPVDHEVWLETYPRESELDFIRMTYSVENDVITVSDPEAVKLTVSPRDINTVVSDYENTISEKDTLIVEASSEINSLKSEITELSQYKEKFEEAEQTRIANELAEKKEALIASVVKSGQITREEIEESEELSSFVNNLDKKSLMAIVGERLSASMETSAKADVEVSSAKPVNASTNLNTSDDEIVSKSAIMRNYLKH